MQQTEFVTPWDNMQLNVPEKCDLNELICVQVYRDRCRCSDIRSKDRINILPMDSYALYMPVTLAHLLG